MKAKEGTGRCWKINCLWKLAQEAPNNSKNIIIAANTYGSYWAAETSASILCKLCIQSGPQPHEIGIVIIFILHMIKLGATKGLIGS